MTEEKTNYASFSQRLGAYLLDFLFILPLAVLFVWGGNQSRFFSAYYLVPGIVFGFWYHVYLVRRYGGTPGKLALKIKITKVQGGPVGYREAFLRYVVLFVLATISQVALLQATLGMSDSDYFVLDWRERGLQIYALAPHWLSPLTLLTNAWIWSEFIVMLTNEKRRAIHDFMAGTIVVRSDPS
jgi:uncharacterized RDD family membrane protein YckC